MPFRGRGRSEGRRSMARRSLRMLIEELIAAAPLGPPIACCFPIRLQRLSRALTQGANRTSTKT